MNLTSPGITIQVESLKESVKEREEEEENGLLSSSNLEPCGPVDCNHRGTCLGSKRTYICACQLGFSGKSCEESEHPLSSLIHLSFQPCVTLPVTATAVVCAWGPQTN